MVHGFLRGCHAVAVMQKSQNSNKEGLVLGRLHHPVVNDGKEGRVLHQHVGEGTVGNGRISHDDGTLFVFVTILFRDS